MAFVPQNFDPQINTFRSLSTRFGPTQGSSWSKRPRWIKWPIYLASLSCTFWGGVELYKDAHSVRGPIIGRLQFKILTRNDMLELNRQKFAGLNHQVARSLVPRNLEIAQTVQRIFKEILVSYDLSEMEFKLSLIESGN